MKQKIVIHVSGGVVQGVYVRTLPIEIEVVDFDDLAASRAKTRTQRERILDRATRGLCPVY